MKLAGCQKRGNKKKTPETALKVRNRKYRSLHHAPTPDSWLCPLLPSLRSSTVEKRFAQIFHTNPSVWEETKFRMGRPGKGRVWKELPAGRSLLPSAQSLWEQWLGSKRTLV